MAAYCGSRLGITPAAGVANWVLEAPSTAMGRIKQLSWGGEATTSTAMRTRVARDSAVGTGSRTAGDVQKVNNLSPANAIFFSTTYATTQPTVVAGGLFGTSWNAHGGQAFWAEDLPGKGPVLHHSGAANLSIECRQDTGTGTSSYVVLWEED
jgi:hypothetical protein